MLMRFFDLRDALLMFALANKYFLYLILTCLVFEYTLGLFLFIRPLFWKKFKSVSFFYRVSVASFYFLFLNISAVIDFYLRGSSLSSFSIPTWVVLVLLMSYGLYRFPDKLPVINGRKRGKKRRIAKYKKST